MKRIVLIALMLFTWINSGICLEDKVVAVVNNEVITRAELDMYINLLKVQPKGANSQGDDISVEKALENMIEDRLVVQEAKRLNVEVSDRLIESRIDRIRESFVSESEFLDFLGQQGLSLTELESRIKEQMLSDKLINIQIRNRIFISPAEVTKYYKDNIKDFYLPERLEAESIFVKDKNKADQIYDKLKEGADFSDLKKQYSERSSLGLVSKGQLRKDIEDIIFNLEIGKFSESIKIMDGYYIFLVRKKLSPSEKELTEVQDQIYNGLMGIKFNDKLEKWLKELKDSSYISIKNG